MTSSYTDKIDAADVISFDVFDTLLIRNVARPADVFKIVKENFNQFSPYYLSANFAEARVKAEQAAFQMSMIVGHDTLDDIYAQFQHLYGYDDAFCTALRQTEIKTEQQALSPNPKVKPLYDHALKNQKKILIVSDMYLPKQIIADTLHANGYTQWDEIIVSCHDKFAKHDGSAFNHICRKYSGQKVLHIGDNLHSDIGWANAYGLETIHIEQDLQELSYETTKATQTARGGKLLEITNKAASTVNDTQQSVVTALIAHKAVDPKMTELESIGYGAFGPLLLGYVQWLHDAARLRGTDHLYFLARDGAIMQRAYQAFYGEAALPNDYIFASRRLYNFAKLADQLTENDIGFLTFADVTILAREYFENFGIASEHPRVRHALQQVGLDPEQPIIIGSADVQKIRAAFMLASDALFEQAAQERSILQAYFKHVGLYKKRQNAIVDIGWWGNMQRSLSALTNQTLSGFYFGVDAIPYTNTVGSAMSGFVDRRLPQDQLFYNIARACVEVTEYLFSNPDQESVTAIAQTGNTFTQVIKTAGKIDPDIVRDNDCLRVIQAAAIEFVHDFKQATNGWADAVRRLDRAVAFQEFSLMVQEPSDQQAIVLGRVKHFFAEGLPPRAVGMPLHDASYYRRHPDALAAERQAAWWKQGFEKNVSIKQLDRYW